MQKRRSIFIVTTVQDFRSPPPDDVVPGVGTAVPFVAPPNGDKPSVPFGLHRACGSQREFANK